ncbi:MAG: TSUP family transporter [Flavobacteriales bacterium]|jgi:hypothetical protein|nr:permease [Flavobacteriales bacterium]MBC8295788.1 sulfite exporter TauE/SafE family protein [Pelagibacterales bacterium]MBL6873905.1 sulfite exporter TauE/SafE family protein [Flavobacteriales bacterium]OUW94239.1 MAG: permease [Flavobacteriales bacterium TMED228]|tara:strand:- start:140 stop:505 length:366 start_codon:yes stop_codon:yes gene_type:complete
MSFITILFLLLIGLLAGMLSGVVGVGGAIVIIPLLLLLGFSQQEAQGTSIAVMLPPIGILAAINYYKSGFVKWEYAIVIAFAFLIGGYVGSKFAISMNPQILKRFFGIVLLVFAIKFILGK